MVANDGRATVDPAIPVLRVLLVEDDPGDAFLLDKHIRRALHGGDGTLPGIALAQVPSLAAALAALAAQRYDAALLDLNLPDSRGLDTLRELRRHVPGLPVVVLTGMEGDAIAVEAIRHGAQDYLSKEHIDGKLVIRTLRYAVERQQRSEAQQKAQLYLDIVRVVMVVVDADGRVVLINRTGADLLGYPEAEILGADWCGRFVPARERERVRGVIRELLAGGQERVGYYENSVLTRDGGERLMAWHNTLVRDSAGRPAGVLSSGEDVTERRRAEQALRRYTERLQGLRAIDRAILAAESPAALAGAALHRARQLIPAAHACIVLVDDGELELLAADPRTPTPEPEPDRRFTAAQLPELDHLRCHRPLRIDDLNAVGYDYPLVHRLAPAAMRSALLVPLLAQDRLIGIMILAALEAGWFNAEHEEIAHELADVLAIAIHQGRLHEQVRAHSAELEQRVRERTEQLRETNAELEAFAYSVSHDLRNPLWNIQGFAELLLEQFGERLGEVGGEYVRYILGAVERMDALIGDLLAYSRISRAELRPAPVPLESVVDETLREYGNRIHEQGAQVEVARPLPVVSGHRATLRQVVDNLVSNALKFVAPGRAPRLTIHGERLDGCARLWVEDNGIGIPAGSRDAVFRVFERLDESYPGSGVGLATVRRAVERMGGRVGVESEAGSGSRFWVELPLAGPG